MLSTKFKRMLRAGVIASCVAAMGCTCTLVYAEPSTGELVQKTSGLQGELNNLNNELDSLCKEMDSISTEMEKISATMQESQQKMDEAQKKGEEQYEAMKLRIKYMYESGNHSFIELLCSADNMADFLNKSDFIQDVSEYDRNMLQELLDTQEEIEKQGDAVARQHEELLELKEELRNKRADLESKIASTSSELSQYQAQLERANAAEQLVSGQHFTESETLASQINNQNNSQVNTGKSLGTFRITHYCPCYYCSGGWGNGTATGTVATPGRTIAVDPSVIPYGSVVVINGHAYVAEDCGGAIKGNKIDIYVSDHATALSSGVYYAEVYLAN
jgi:peptidoglycan hydrolase CwlO-like protein